MAKLIAALYIVVLAAGVTCGGIWVRRHSAKASAVEPAPTAKNPTPVPDDVDEEDARRPSFAPLFRANRERDVRDMAKKAARDPQYREWLLTCEPEKYQYLHDDEHKEYCEQIHLAQKMVLEGEPAESKPEPTKDSHDPASRKSIAADIRASRERLAREHAEDAARDPKYREWLLSTSPEDAQKATKNIFNEEEMREFAEIHRLAQKMVLEGTKPVESKPVPTAGNWPSVAAKMRASREQWARLDAEKAAKDPKFREWLLSTPPEDASKGMERIFNEEERRELAEIHRLAQKMFRGEVK